MAETVDAPVVQEPEKASFFEDMVDIIVAPSKVFARRLDRSVLLTIVIFTLLTLGLAFANRNAMGPAIDAEIDRQIATMMEQNPQMTAESLGPARAWMGFMFSYGIAIMMPILFLVVALGLWLVSKFFDAKIGYGDALVISTWSFVPRILGMVLFAVQGLLTDPTQYKGILQMSFGVARFLDPDTTSAGMIQLLARVEVFTIWSTILLGIGLAVAGKIPRGRAMVAAAIVWVLGALPAVLTVVRGG